MSDTTKNNRYLCADLLACLGVILLLALQYIQATGFLEEPVNYESTPHIAVRWFCLSGAMLLSACMGFVASEKYISWRSFKPLLRLGYIYIICSLCAMLMQKVMLDQEIDSHIILETLSQFTTTDTTKFIAMYFALILAAPFLSAAFRDLKTYQARFAFLAISAGVSTLQPMLIISGKYLLPEWCKLLAPIAGFVGGAFVKCYAKNHSRILWFFLLLLVSVLQTVSVVFICTERGCLYYPQFDSMASLPSLIIALLILSLFHSKNYGDSGLHSFFAGASGGTLSALILGDIMIDFLMPSIAENFPDTKNLLFVGFLAVPVIFILCCTIGLFLQIPIFIVHAVTDDVYEEDDEEDEDDDDEEELEKPEKIPVQKQKPIRALDPIEVVSSETVSIKYKSMKRVQEPTALVPIRESIPKAEPVNKPVNKSEHQASLDEILKEQKISAISTKDSISVDELIAKITK